CSQGRRGSVLAGPVQISEEVAAAEQAFRQGHHELAGAQAPVALLDRPGQRVDRLDEAERSDRLAYAHHPRRTRQRRVIGTNLHQGPAMAYLVHPTGAFRPGLVRASATRIVPERKALVADGPRTPQHYLRIQV